MLSRVYVLIKQLKIGVKVDDFAGQKTTEKRVTEKTTAKMEALKIGDSAFNNYAEYEKAYIEKWEKTYTNARPDLNWVIEDWNYRLNCQKNGNTKTSI